MNDEDDLTRRRLGLHGPRVPVLGLGSWNTWDRMTADEAVALVDRACEVGAGFFDVAYYNTGPHAENSRTDLLFADAFRASGRRREDVVLCGKLWLWNYPDSSFADQIAESLGRIDQGSFDTIVVGDYFGEPDVEAIVEDVHALVETGQIGSWGINNWRIEHTRRALRVARERGLTPPTFTQLKYSIARRSMAEGAEYGALFSSGELGLQASDVFEGGILAGKLQPQRKIGADVGSIRDRIVALYPHVQRIAGEFAVSPAQLGIAFVLANPAVGSVLFGASRLNQLDENVGALELYKSVGPDALRQALASAQLDDQVRSDGTW